MSAPWLLVTFLVHFLCICLGLMVASEGPAGEGWIPGVVGAGNAGPLTVHINFWLPPQEVPGQIKQGPFYFISPYVILHKPISAPLCGLHPGTLWTRDGSIICDSSELGFGGGWPYPRFSPHFHLPSLPVVLSISGSPEKTSIFSE